MEIRTLRNEKYYIFLIFDRLNCRSIIFCQKTETECYFSAYRFHNFEIKSELKYTVRIPFQLINYLYTKCQGNPLTYDIFNLFNSTILGKINIEKEPKTYPVCVPAYARFLHICSLTQLSDGLDIRSWSDY